MVGLPVLPVLSFVEGSKAEGSNHAGGLGACPELVEVSHRRACPELVEGVVETAIENSPPMTDLTGVVGHYNMNLEPTMNDSDDPDSSRSNLTTVLALD